MKGAVAACCLCVAAEARAGDLVLTANAPGTGFITTNLACTVTVSNAGPTPATGVVLTHTFPPSAYFVSVGVSQGSWAETNGVITCNAGALAPGAVMQTFVTVVPAGAGTLTQTASVVCVEADDSAGNNSALAITTIAPPAYRPRVLVLSTVSTAANRNVQTNLLNTGFFSQVATQYLADCSAPSLDTLLSYDAILFSSFSCVSSNVGNVLADYVDRGGGLVVCAPAFEANSSKGISGRLLSGGYLPFTMGTSVEFSNVAMVKVIPSHPILSNVVSFESDYGPFHPSISVTNGAELIARWQNGAPLVAVQQGDTARIGGLNFQPSGYWGSPHWDSPYGFPLIANTLRFVAPADRFENDLVLHVRESQDPVGVGTQFSYIIKVTNRGPAPSSTVTVTSTIPTGATLQQVSTSQGGFELQGSNLIWHTGSVPPGGIPPSLTVRLQANTETILSNRTTLGRMARDPYLDNNTVSTLTTVTRPGASVGNVTVNEGNSGQGSAVFTFRLNMPGSQAIWVRYQTVDGTAVAGSDYTATAGLLIFSPGQTNKTVAVPVLGDSLAEPNQNFFMEILGVTNGVAAGGPGVGTILNDDPLPFVFFYDNSTNEGNIGPRNFVLRAGLSSAAGAPVSVHYSTVFGSATPGVDYVATNGVIEFQTGMVETNVTIVVHGDTALETDETFRILLSSANNAIALANPSTQTIIEDDGLPNQVHDFTWDVPSPQTPGNPFAVTVRARDAFGNTAEAFNGTVSISGRRGPAGEQLPVAPTTSGSFSNGIWTGAIVVQNAATNFVLVADDGDGHTGMSAPFQVLPANDVGVTMTSTPGPITAGANLVYTLVVSNTGPNAANGVSVTNFLPANVTVDSAVSSQGSCVVSNGVLTCSIGTLGGGQGVTLQIVTTPAAPGFATNRALVVRAEPEEFPDNNSASTLTEILFPSLSLAGNVVLQEGNSGTTNAVFEVRLQFPLTASASVQYETKDSGAIAGKDYDGSAGTVVFAPGETNQTIVVPVFGERVYEADEFFSLVLTGAVNAILTGEAATCRIVNDDPLPVFSLGGSVSATEGNTSSKAFYFPIQLSNPSDAAASVGFEVLAGGSATAGSDYYRPASATFFAFAAGQTNTNAVVLIYGDTLPESNEVFSVRLALGSGAGISAATATGTILNDDGLPGEAHSFVWDRISSPQLDHEPFNVRITAKDFSNQTASNFNGAVSLEALRATGFPTNRFITETASDSSLTGVTAGWSFTPAADITVTRVGYYISTNVSIWTDDGQLLATVQGFAGSFWQEASLAKPVRLKAGVRYRVSTTPTSPTASCYRRNVLPPTFPHGEIHQSFQRSGYGFPDQPSSGLWLVNLIYELDSNLVVPIEPAVSGNFVNGVWSGNLAVLQPATNISVTANDGNGHSGTSTNFSVWPRNDLSIWISDLPDPIAVNMPLTYTLWVGNSGPAAATDVIVSNVLPAGVTFVSASSPQGTWTESGGAVVFNLGTIPGGTNFNVTITVSPNALGMLLNFATITGAIVDSNPANDAFTSSTFVVTPSLRIGDASVVERDTGFTNILFQVTLQPASAIPVTVNYATANSNAIADADYVPASGTVTFAPGETSKTISIAVINDLAYENTETFLVILSNPTNALIGDGQGLGMIFNNDSMPILAVGSVSEVEGNVGPRLFVFPITLSNPSGLAVRFTISTVANSAGSPSDYMSRSASITLPPGIAATNFQVVVNGDLNIESTETFFVQLSGVEGALSSTQPATGTIVNDDGRPGELWNFVWSPIPSPQFVGVPFQITIRAADQFNVLATNYHGPADLISGPPPRTALGNRSHTSFVNGTFTAGYAFTPTTRITVTHVRHYYGSKVSIWTDSGTLLASRNVVSTPGAWVETPLLQPLTLNTGATYRIAAYESPGTTYRFSPTPTAPGIQFGAAWRSDADAFPNISAGGLYAMVDMRYTVGPQPPVITPTVTGNFTNGIWTGSVTVLDPIAFLTLTVTDANGHTNTSASFEVRSNSPPGALSQSFNLDEDTPKAIELYGEDLENLPLSYLIVTNPAHGTLTGIAPNVVYQPHTNYFGPDSFSFKVNDGYFDSAPATISLTVLPAADPPAAFAQAVAVAEDGSVAIVLAGSDPDGDPLTFQFTLPAHGILSGTPPNLVYQPNPDYFGPDSFEFTASDGVFVSAPATVNVNVSPVNDAPQASIAVSPLAEFPDITNLVVIAVNGSNQVVVLDGSGSSDPENDPLTFTWLDDTNLLASGMIVTNELATGSHPITLIVEDGADADTAEALVEVIKPSEAVGLLILLVQDSSLGQSAKNPLFASLRAAAAAFSRGNTTAALNQLKAFQNKVRTQVAPLDPELAEKLVRAAEILIEKAGAEFLPPAAKGVEPKRR